MFNNKFCVFKATAIFFLILFVFIYVTKPLFAFRWMSQLAEILSPVMFEYSHWTQTSFGNPATVS